MLRARLGLLAALAATGLVAVAGCTDDDQPAGATTSTTERPPWSGQGEDDLWLALDDACRAANDAAAADADAMLPIDTEVDRDDLAQFYRNRSQQVTAVAAHLAELAPPQVLAADWPELLDGLQSWAAWADQIADEVRADGVETDQTQDPGLEQFRRAFDWGACVVLLDVN